MMMSIDIMRIKSNNISIAISSRKEAMLNIDFISRLSFLISQNRS